MTLILFCVLFLYLILIGSFVFGLAKIKTIPYHSLAPKTSFTIIVPFRNEGDNLPVLLASFSQLDYPIHLFEVILVDDSSREVFSVQKTVFSLFLVENIRKSNSPKKDAIETAIKLAKNDWIITTDADCRVQKEWLKAFDSYIQKNDIQILAAGVRYSFKKRFLHAFQNLDFLSLQGATLGSFGIQKPFMCNGANFGYKKDFFYELNGFAGNEMVASGDDVFLLQKGVLNQPEKVHFLYDERSIVTTKSVDSWRELFHQRVRWASKSRGYHSVFGKITALLVFATNLSAIIVVILWLSQKMNTTYFLLFFATKFIIDISLLFQTNRYFKTKLNGILLSTFLYPFFSTAVALYSLFGKYTWKDRQFKK